MVEPETIILSPGAKLTPIVRAVVSVPAIGALYTMRFCGRVEPVADGRTAIVYDAPVLTWLQIVIVDITADAPETYWPAVYRTVSAFEAAAIV